jgi:hypothetical protein
MLTLCFSEHLAFTFTPAPSVREVKLILLSGDCEINCNGNENNCDLFQEEHTMKDVRFFNVKTDFVSRFRTRKHTL